MKAIITNIKAWLSQSNRQLLWIVSIFTALLVATNYRFNLQQLINQLPMPQRFISQYLLLLVSFAIPWLWVARFKNIKPCKSLTALIFLAPFIFAIKMTVPTRLAISIDPYWNHYWNTIIYWPVRLLLMIVFLWIIKKIINDKTRRFYGLSWTGMTWKPYMVMLLVMIPVIGIAAFDARFLLAYPKIKQILPIPADDFGWYYMLLFECSYGLDFLNIELFFRGFLVLSFLKYAGRDVILPMACFYCIIHFGKPLPECISSYFGGIILGIFVYHTRSITGGLFVHLGIAWLMELGGFIGNS